MAQRARSEPKPGGGAAAALRAKRRTTALTTATLAERIGVDEEDIDAAIAAQPVAGEAAARLQAWAAA